MKQYIKKITIFVLFCSVPCGFLQAKVRSIMTRRDFERNLAKNTMVIVLFYEHQKGNKELRKKNRALIRMYEDLSSYRPYDDADIVFLKINVGRKDLTQLVDLYNVEAVPTIMFFSNGQHTQDDQGMPVMVTGFVPRGEVQAVIDQYYGQEVQKRIEEKEERRKQIVSQENESWKLYFYPRYTVVKDYDPSERDME